MTLSYNETRRLIDLVLDASSLDARPRLHATLQQMNRAEPEFCMGVIEHGRSMSYTSADFLFKVPNILFEHESWLINKLSEKQRQQLRLD